MFYFGCCLAAADCGGGRGCGWAGDVFAVRWWWLEERRLVHQLVKMAAVCQSAGSSALRVCFRRS